MLPATGTPFSSNLDTAQPQPTLTPTPTSTLYTTDQPAEYAQGYYEQQQYNYDQTQQYAQYDYQQTPYQQQPPGDPYSTYQPNQQQDPFAGYDYNAYQYDTTYQPQGDSTYAGYDQSLAQQGWQAGTSYTPADGDAPFSQGYNDYYAYQDPQTQQPYVNEARDAEPNRDQQNPGTAPSPQPESQPTDRTVTSDIEPTTPLPPMKKPVEYNPETGWFSGTDTTGENVRKVARQYIQDRATGDFYKIRGPNMRSRFKSMMSRNREEEEQVQAYDHDDSVPKGGLQTTVETLSNFMSLLGLFTQGLLGGLALINLFMTYLVFSSAKPREFLRFYAPLAQTCNRAYFTLITLSAIAAISKYSYYKIHDFEPTQLRLGIQSGTIILLYVVAYVASVVATPLEDTLTYEASRNPEFWRLTFSSEFQSQLDLWQAMNWVRMIMVGVAWIMVCRLYSPKFFASVVEAEVRRRLQEIEKQTVHASMNTTRTLVQLPTTPVRVKPAVTAVDASIPNAVGGS